MLILVGGKPVPAGGQAQVDANFCQRLVGQHQPLPPGAAFTQVGFFQSFAQVESGVQLRFYLDELPFLEGAREYADQWLFPAGTCNNESAYQHGVTFDPGIEEEMQQLLYTPETSGGLLVSVDPKAVEALVALFREAKHPCWVVGEVVEGEGVHVAA